LTDLTLNILLYTQRGCLNSRWYCCSRQCSIAHIAHSVQAIHNLRPK